LAHEKEIPHVHATSAEQQLAAPNNNVVPHQSASTAVAHIVGVTHYIVVILY
jgi:hypothetical protein